MEERIHILIAKKLTGEAMKEELQELEDWRAAHSDNAEQLKNAEQLWAEGDEIIAAKKFDKHAAWEKISHITEVHAAIPVQKKVVLFPSWLKAAVAAAAVVLLGVFIVQSNNAGDVVILAEAGDNTVLLPDNSKIILKKGSRLSYGSGFDKNERHVALEGEAFFDVARDEQKPFIINAQKVSVQVLGTSFYVRSGSSAYVAVITGKVQVKMSERDAGKLVLTPGKTGRIEDDMLKEEQTDVQDLMYWKTGQLNFAGVPLATLVARLDKIFSESVRLSDDVPESVAGQVVNITFNRQGVADMLRELCLVTGCQLRENGNEYIIAPLQ